jgi:hypothetical protein
MIQIPPYALVDSDHGLSAEAEWLRDLFSPEVESGPSAAFCRPVWDLNEVFEEASRGNWDGYGAKAVSLEAYLAAREFLASFASGESPEPEISASPRGEILVEWSAGPRHVFTLAFGQHGDKYYAGLFGPNKTAGREDLLDQIVAITEKGLARLCSARAPRAQEAEVVT